MLSMVIVNLFVMQAKFAFITLRIYISLFLFIGLAFFLQILSLIRKNKFCYQYTAVINKIEFSFFHKIRCCIYFDDLNDNRINTKTHYVFTGWHYSDLVSTDENVSTLQILYNSVTKQVIVLNNPTPRYPYN